MSCCSSSEHVTDVFGRGFMRRGDCGDWIPGLQKMYIFANEGIFWCYLIIAGALIYAYLFERNARDFEKVQSLSSLERSTVRLSYAAFILCCGIGHKEHSLAFDSPQYHLFAIWALITFVVSASAVVVTLRHRVRLVSMF